MHRKFFHHPDIWPRSDELGNFGISEATDSRDRDVMALCVSCAVGNSEGKAAEAPPEADVVEAAATSKESWSLI